MSPEKHDLARYAEALLALAEASGRLPAIESDVAKILQLLHSSSELRSFLENPAVSSQGKNRTIEEVMPAGICPTLVHFLQILQEEGYIRFFSKIAEIFHQKTAIRRKKRYGR